MTEILIVVLKWAKIQAIACSKFCNSKSVDFISDMPGCWFKGDISALEARESSENRE